MNLAWWTPNTKLTSVAAFSPEKAAQKRFDLDGR